MNPIIPIAERSIGAASIATVNARRLHGFLEVGKDFSTWIKDRIEQYSFIEGADYVEVFPEMGENLQDGTHACRELVYAYAMRQRPQGGAA